MWKLFLVTSHNKLIQFERNNCIANIFHLSFIPLESNKLFLFSLL